jgi:hypothetical protein
VSVNQIAESFVLVLMANYSVQKRLIFLKFILFADMGMVMNITTYVRFTKNVHAESRNFIQTHRQTQSLYIYVVPSIYIFRHLLT